MTAPASTASAAPASIPRARVADEVAAAALRRLAGLLPGLPAVGGIGCAIDWRGPVEVDLADETAVQAACGVMHVHGRAAGRPLPLAVDYASTVAGLLGAQGVLAAAVARARGRRVDAVRTSVAQGALLAVSQYLAAATADDPDGDPAETIRAGGAPPFVSADGVRFEIETLDADGWVRFWARLGADPAAVRAGWPPFLHRFATATCALPEALHTRAHRTDFPAVLAAARNAGIGALPVRADPGHPDDRPPWTMRPLPRTGRPLPAPTGPGPLHGLVVVESTTRVQGPLAGHVLRMLGADVVRVEPPGGDPMRGVPPIAGGCSARFVALNAGKRAVETDLKSPAGRAAARELVAGADVFLHNWAPGRAARFGLDAAELAGVRPGLVYAHASGWAPDDDPAAADDAPPCTDFLVQARSGVAAAVRAAGEPPAPSLMTLTDVLGGLVSALGVLAAVASRAHTGLGVRVDSGLFGAAGVLPRRRRPPGPFDRPLRTADGHLLVGDGNPGRVARALGLDPWARPAAVAAWVRGEPTDGVAARLGRHGVRRPELVGAVLLSAALGGFLVAADPRRSTAPSSPALLVVAALSASVAVVAFLVIVARKRGGRTEAVLLSAGAGILLGLQDAATRQALLGDWTHAFHSPWSLVVIGTAVTALLLLQSAFRVGDLPWSLPPLVAAEPVAGIAIGIGVLGDRIDGDAVSILFESLCLAGMVAGLVLIARSQAITSLRSPQPG